MIKLVVQLTASPTLPEAVLASWGITSERTTQVTGPNPIEKAHTKATIEAAERPAMEPLIPMESVTAATLMTSVGKSNNGLEPTRYYQPRWVGGHTSMRKAGTRVRGIFDMTINRAINLELPLKTGLRIRVEKYMTGEIPHVCWDI
jgi:hypothetical protein